MMRKFPKVADVVDDSEKTRTKALQALRTVLENAAKAGADTVELEYGGDNRLDVSYMFGDTGAGGTLITRELEWKVIQIIVEKARLKNRCCGTMEMELLGERRSILVHEYESFGESAFRLILRPRRKSKQYRGADAE